MTSIALDIIVYIGHSTGIDNVLYWLFYVFPFYL